MEDFVFLFFLSFNLTGEYIFKLLSKGRDIPVEENSQNVHYFDRETTYFIAPLLINMFLQTTLY